jgi:hypothetical protein
MPARKTIKAKAARISGDVEAKAACIVERIENESSFEWPSQNMTSQFLSYQPMNLLPQLCTTALAKD